MIVTTSSDVRGRAITEVLGVVRGIVVRVPTRRQRIRGSYARWMAEYEDGRNPYYLEVAEAVRADAYSEMIRHAESVGADAVVAARFQTTQFAAEGVTEGLAYGTAVRLGQPA